MSRADAPLFDEALQNHLSELLVLMDPAREMIHRIATVPVSEEEETDLIGYGVIYGMDMLEDALESGVPLEDILA